MDSRFQEHMQRLQQAQLRQHAGQRQSSLPLGSNNSLNNLSQGMGQMGQNQFANQQWMDPSQQSQGSRNSFTGVNPMALLQQQTGQSMGMGQNNAMFYNPLGNNKGAGGLAGMGGSGMGMGGSSSAMQALFQQGAMGMSGNQNSLMGGGGKADLGGVNSMINKQQMLNPSFGKMGSSNSLMDASGRRNSSGQFGSANTSDQLLLQQQKVIENLQRQLAQQGQGAGGAGNMISGSGMDRRGSGGNMMTAQQLMQMQALQGGASSSMFPQMAGMMPDPRGGGGAGAGGLTGNQSQQQQKRGSASSTEPISLQSLMSGQGNQTNMGMGRGGSSGSDNTMGQMGGGSSNGGGSGSGNSSFLMQQQQQQQLSSMNKGGLDQQLLAAQQQHLMNTSGLGGLGQSGAGTTGQGSSSKSNDLMGGLKTDLMGAGSGGGLGEEKSKTSSGQSSKKEKESSGGSSGQQSFLDGTFNGGWQSNADIPDRRRVIYSICKVIEQMRPDARQMSQKLPFMAKRLEEHLYRSAQTKEEYLDPSTLKKRLQMIAHGLEVHRGGGSSSSSSKKDTSSSSPPFLASSSSKGSSSSAIMSTAEITATQQKMKQLMQQIQQIQQLLQLQHQQGLGATPATTDLLKQQNILKEQILREQTKIQQAQQQLTNAASMQQQQQQQQQQGDANFSDMMSQSQQSVLKNSSKRSSGILKSSSSKYQDPQKRKMHKQQQVIKQQQQRLLLLRHASKCKIGPECKVKFCEQMVQLWKHMKKCRDKNCKTPHCLSSRCVLNHYRICKSENKTATCEVCGPVMRQIKQQGPQGGDDSNSSGNGNKHQSQGSGTVRDQPAQQSGGSVSGMLDSMGMNPLGNMSGATGVNNAGSMGNDLGGMSVNPGMGGAGVMDPNSNVLANLSGMVGAGNAMDANALMANAVASGNLAGVGMGNPMALAGMGNPALGGMGGLGGNGLGGGADGKGENTKSEKQVQELQQAQQKIQQQHELLKQLQDQQAQLLEQQNRLQQRQRHVLPQTHQGQQLQEQQALLQQLQQKFQQQQMMLQHELLRQSSVLEKNPNAPQITSSGRVTVDKQDPKKRSSQTRGLGRQKSGGQLSGINVAKPSRGRMAGGKGKRLSALESHIPHPDNDSVKSGLLDPMDSFEPGSNKRDADEIGSSFDGPPTKKRLALDEVVSTDVPSSGGSKIFVQGDLKSTVFGMLSMSGDAIKQHLASLTKDIHLSPKLISQTCLPIIRRLLDDQFGWVFRDPVDPGVLGLPDYFEVVERPRHLGLIEKKLVTSSYQDLESFVTDAKLVFENAILYNGQDSEVGEMAQRMIDRFVQDFNNVVDGMKSSADHLVPGSEVCSLCNSQRRLLHPVALVCTGGCGKQNILVDSQYYSDATNSTNWCSDCYSDLGEDEEVKLDNGKQVKKGELQKKKNDVVPEEAWIQCGSCNSWMYQTCALFNGDIDKLENGFECPKCVLAKRQTGKLECPLADSRSAFNLPRCTMSNSIEKGLEAVLTKAYMEEANRSGKSVADVDKAHALSVRVISNVEMNDPVGEQMLAFFGKDGFPSSFPTRSKCIALFQTIEGADVMVLGMLVKEYDHSCPGPNRRRVYISHLDSVNFFTPKCYSTVVYQALVVEYLRCVKERGFHTAHIWSCPPAEGDDALFHRHPPAEEPPRDDLLRKWYLLMLERARDEGVVLETKALYDEYFGDGGIGDYLGKKLDPTCLPYFEGDFVPMELESILAKAAAADKQSDSNDEELPGRIMTSLTDALLKIKNNFIVAHLHSRKFAAAVDRGEDVSNWVEPEEIIARNKRPQIGGKTSPGTMFPSVKANLKETAEESKPKALVIKEEPLKPPDDGMSKKDVHDKDDDAISLGTVSVSLGPKDSSLVDAFGLDDSDKGGKDDLDPLTLDIEPEALDIRGGGGEDHDDALTGRSLLDSESQNKRGFDEIEPAIARFAAERSSKRIGDTSDPDEPFERDLFESRQQFVDYCQRNNYQFDELRRAKHSTMVLLFKLHNSAPQLIRQCGACYKPVLSGPIHHCTVRPDYDLCENCYKPVTSGEWSDKGPSYQHDTTHKFEVDDARSYDKLPFQEHNRLVNTYVDKLVRTASCDDSTSDAFCPKMKKLIEIMESGDVESKDYREVCSRMASLVRIHARKCTTKGPSPVPTCDLIREGIAKRRKRQAAMDERRWRAQKELYQSAPSSK